MPAYERLSFPILQAYESGCDVATVKSLLANRKIILWLIQMTWSGVPEQRQMEQPKIILIVHRSEKKSYHISNVIIAPSFASSAGFMQQEYR